MSHPRTLSTIRQLRYDLPNGEGVLTRRDKINLQYMFDGMTFNIERHELVVSNLRGKPDRYIERAAETAMDVISRNELRHPRNTARDGPVQGMGTGSSESNACRPRHRSSSRCLV